MRVERLGVALILAAGLAVLPGCAVENGAAPASGTVQKGGDERERGICGYRQLVEAGP